MLPKKIEELIEPVVVEFVKGLNGFYKKHCSDEFLVALIMFEISKPSSLNSMHSVAEDIVIGGNHNAVYTTVCWLFETVLEYGCHTGRNGHHVAQKFAEEFEKITGIALPL